ncbi:hypothetical protein MJI12_27675, partial [Salmonella enterica subsp. enterica serovar Kentucky]|nr:hypothetical protein [Salmonella enterica subsp. enterica serovar Kentucky]
MAGRKSDNLQWRQNLFIAWLSLLLYGCTTFPQAVKPTTGGQLSPTEIYIVSHGW